jgi:hypothetical protein
MARWLYEPGIGEARAALIEDGRIIEMAVEPETDAPRAGAVLIARLVAKTDGGGRGRIAFDGGEALLAQTPKGLTEGSRLSVRVVREAYVEPGGQPKLAIAQPAEAGATPSPGPDLLARINASGHPVDPLSPHDPDALEAAGWSEALEEATSGIVARPQALLRISLTPAMTLVDIDGSGPAADLARVGAALAGEIIRRFGITGSIGLDLPTLPARADRLAAAAALDATLPQPFERTAVNGFGFLQIVRRRIRPSLPEGIAADPIRAAACALLRRAERAPGHGSLTLTAASSVIALIDARPRWREAFSRRTGAPLVLRADPALSISAGHAQRDHP